MIDREVLDSYNMGNENNKSFNVDDIIETVNHFICFDYMLDNASEELSEDMIKEFHRILKSGTSDARKDWFNVRRI